MMVISDRRLIKDPVLVKPQQEKKGLGDNTWLFPNIYTWEWNDKGVEVFKERKQRTPRGIGVIAQELELIGFASYTAKEPTNVEGLDGVVRLVNAEALMKYGDHFGFNKKEDKGA